MNEIRRRAAAFALAWADSPGDERQEGQSFVRDLLAVYGITETRAAFYEKRSKRSSTGGQGYIDALIPGLALIEMKSAGRDLIAAEQQALDYIDDLPDPEVPTWVLTSDFKKFRLLDLTADSDAPVEFTLAELVDQADRLAFLAGYGQRAFGSREQEQASIAAAKLMASLYEALEGSGYTDHEASIFLVRTLFALYADDAGVWDRDIFLEFIESRTAEDGSDLGPQLALLYQVMGTELGRRQRNLDEFIGRFPYVNGGIFEEPLSIPSFDSQMRSRLLEAAGFNWAAISPAIFGSLFQAVKDKKARRKLGEHYTTESNILKLIGPMFLDTLRRRFAEGFNDTKALSKLRRDMGKMVFLDPACGCGNFLVVAYREMRTLDLEILVRLQQLGGEGLTLAFMDEHLSVRLSSFHGIEIEEWPARIATTALHLVDHQANRAMELALGQAPEPLPLDKIDTIHDDNALTVDWATFVGPTEHLYIMGNPPFLGHASREDEQAEELRIVWRRKDIGRLDYVTGWYAKAMELFDRPGYSGEFAFVSTNSIVQGEPVPALFRPLFSAGWRIKFAHRTFAWTSEAPGAASVHCVIIGFDQRRRQPAWLYDYPEGIRGPATRIAVEQQINAYLVDGASVLVEQRRSPLTPSLPLVTMGSMPRDGGNLLIQPDDLAEFEADPVASRYVRPFVMGKEFINDLQRWCLWLTDLDPSDIGRSSLLKRRLEGVRAFREASTAKSTRQMAETPHLFGQRSQPETTFVAIPSVFAESRTYATCASLEPTVIAGNKVYKCDDPSGFAFAVLASKMFITWQKTVGGRLKSDPNFSNTIVWNTLPIPPTDERTRAAIIVGGQAVLDARALSPERSLADHYNPLAMAPELLRAHRLLDAAVDKLYGIKPDSTNLERQRALFRAYERLSEADTLKVPAKATRKRRQPATA